MMSIPAVYDLALPVLKVLAGGQIVSTRRITTSLAGEFALSEADLLKTRRDGRPLFQNRIQWARTYLKKAGLLEYPEPCASRITEKGLQLLATDPRQLGKEFFAQREAPPPRQLGLEEVGSQETLEDELRRLTGPAVADDRAWDIVKRLNGWGPSPPTTYQKVSKETGIDTDEILALGRKCRRPIPQEAPMLDAALRLTLDRRDQDPDCLALTLASFGITSGVFSMAGLCEAARRFGRFEEWRKLIEQLSKTPSRTARPRPFDSWFEIDVFLLVTDLGHRVLPQSRIGNYRVDLLLPDFVQPVVIECDGERYHRGERADRDRAREKYLQERGFQIVRFSYTTFKAKPDSIKHGLSEILSSAETVGLQLRAG